MTTVKTTVLIVVTMTALAYVGRTYWRRRRYEPISSEDPENNPRELEQEPEQEREEQGTSFLPFTIDDIQETTNSFVNTVFNTQFFGVDSALEDLYPKFERQIENLKESYTWFWNFLSLDEFRAVIDETRKEDADASLNPEIEWEARVRRGTGLSQEEETFLAARRARLCTAFAAFVGVNPDEVHPDDVPIVGIASSGGGYRAMVASSGYMMAMKEAGAYDCVTYTAGVSGSTWTLAQYYSSLTNTSFETLLSHLKTHIHTHIANLSNFVAVLQASAHNAKLLLQGIIQRYHQQNNSLRLVDIFGMLLGGTLLTKKQIIRKRQQQQQQQQKKQQEDEGEDSSKYSESIEDNDDVRTLDDHGTVLDDDGAEIRPKLMQKEDLKISRQQRFIEDGALPMPIYCAVRHEIKEDEDTYHWFEFTPYEMGSEDLRAWIPVWAFGRKFEDGHSIEKLPEQTLGILMGVFGSAFVASLAHFYQEVRLVLPEGALERADQLLEQFQTTLSSVHPISPASFPNPFYKIEQEDNQQLEIGDAGLDNNIPFYPLMRQDRHVDMIIALDLSADIHLVPHLDRAHIYAERRQITGWPSNLKWPKPGDNDAFGTCSVFQEADCPSPITVAYFPLVRNEGYDPEFDPQKAEFCSTWNFCYTDSQVTKLAGLAQRNFQDNVEHIREAMRDVWQRKRSARLSSQS